MSEHHSIKKAIKKTQFYSIIEKIKYFYLQRMISSGLSFHVLKNGKDLENLYKLRFEVFCLEKNYLDPKKYPNGLETDDYDQYSIQFLAKDKKSCALAGGIRLIKNSDLGFPMEKDFSFNINKNGIKNSKILEVSRLIVSPKYRKRNTGNHNVLMGLLKASYHYSKENNYEYWVAAIDRHVFNLLKKFGFAFEILGPGKNYMGSESIPVLINTKNEIQWLKVVNPELCKFFESNKLNLHLYE